jgi:hypothetical protein
MLEYLPPRTAREVIVDGFAVPNLEARESKDGLSCDIMLDHRFGVTVPANLAQQVIWLIANAMAIGAGYSCHGENSTEVNPFKVRVSEIDIRG